MPDTTFPRTKIVCTIGPVSRSPEMIEKLVRAGMNVARLNFSHGTRREHAETIERVRAAEGSLGGPVAILQDLAGFKIRIGEIAGGGVRLEPGSRFTLTTRDIEGSGKEVSVGYPDLASEVRVGETLLLSDGAIELKVDSVAGPDVVCTVVVGGRLGARKGLSIPGRTIGRSGLTDKDRDDLMFGIVRGVDLVALSFVRDAKDVEEARGIIEEHGTDTPLIAKIENQEALDNIDGILEAVDGIMVARGDLGVKTPIARIPRVQKALIEMSNRAGKPVITATHMLRSMISSPRPTRAEVTDVANSILDGTDAVMLSEETAVGEYPLEAVRTMAEVALDVEIGFPHALWLDHPRVGDHRPVSGAMALAACRLAEDLDAAAILTCTSTGSTARSVARCRPRRPVLALTPSEATYRRLALSWGVIPRKLDRAGSTDEVFERALRVAVQDGVVGPGDRVVITAGVPVGVAGGTNLIKVEKVS